MIVRALTLLLPALLAAAPRPHLTRLQEPGPGASEAGQIVLELRSGELELRPLEGLRADWLGPAGALSLRFPALPKPQTGASAATTAAVEFVGGDRVVGRVVGGRGEILELELAGNVPLPVAVEDLASFAFPARVPTGRSLEPADSEDRLYWLRASGLDVVGGTFEEFTTTGVRFFSRELEAVEEFPWAEVAALYLELFEESEAVEEPADSELPGVSLDLIDGSRLRGRLTELGPDGCLIELRGGQLVALSIDVLVEIARDDGELVYLSELRPSAASEASLFGDDIGLRWPYRLDRSTSGAALVAGGVYYTRGIGVHAPSVLTWELDGGWRELRGSVAIDDEVLGLPGRDDASVEFRVWLDGALEAGGQPAWSSGVLRAGDAVEPLGGSGFPSGLSLDGVRSLTLEVDMADKLFVCDRADWLRVRLVR